ncbi:hypothetical protein H9L13_02490 [Sphingomonas lutea]|uniref:Signal transduction histidine kinase subgroup 3 dimerisation and phosphoacceptor domain-containing protein n=1 Tax=Sphingomonas lutea TaxID=1045317 RepID=A0A7G9SIZ2_9SPHN|nr:histidine kinase [Sphingomonas lutea]QNN67817.1 hypothetical protein H9L13_02490 [Sphingomonas lutea]
MIALGRLLLASLFLVVVWIDWSHPRQVPPATYPLLWGYLLFAVVITCLTWKNWWLDAQSGGPAHAVDIALFTSVVYLTEGDKSPFFTFFVFVLLAAAIRWGWRATALTAVLLTLLYVMAGLATPGPDLELGRFVGRTGHLVILSLILIWFGVHRWQTRASETASTLVAEGSAGVPTIEAALHDAIVVTRAAGGALVWVRSGGSKAIVATERDGAGNVDQAQAADFSKLADAPFLYDVAHHRALRRDADGNLQAQKLGPLLGTGVIDRLGLREGLAVPLLSQAGEGQLFLEGMPALSSDSLDLGTQVGAHVAAQMHRRALMKAAEESAESRSRLAIARDLHDSVVQFLAGAAFRLEAMKRSSERDLTPELDELKQLMLQEQVELRGFIAALRDASQVEVEEVAKDLKGLADRLGRQWHVQCTFSAEDADVAVPTRLHLDAQQLVREAVANAVRHAGAKNVSIRLRAANDALRLDFINDGTAFPKSGEGARMPMTLRERVEAAGGALDLSRGMGVTRLSISLPLGGRAA